MAEVCDILHLRFHFSCELLSLFTRKKEMPDESPEKKYFCFISNSAGHAIFFFSSLLVRLSLPQAS